MAGKIAVVTGSNKGIGFAIVEELLKRRVSHVYLTSRDLNRGQEAVKKLKEKGLNPEFHQLEVTNEDSVKQLAKDVKEKHGGIDILFNNAALPTESFTETTYEDSVKVLNTNYYSFFNIQKHLFPVLKDDARVINISSDCGHISNLENKYWIERLTKEDIKVDDINAFVEWFLESVKNNSMNKDDFVDTKFLAYRISKIAVCALTRVQQKEVGRGISVNSIHPGFVKTDMTKQFGQLTMEEASKAPVYLALDVDQSVKGRYFWYDKSEKDWADHSQKWHVDRPEILNFMKSMGIYEQK